MDNPTDDNLIQMDIIRKDIGRLLEEKAKNILPERQELNIKGLSNLAKSRITYSKINQSKIPFLQHPLKGRVDTSSDMVDAAWLFYKELYDIKPIDTSCWDELFTDIPVTVIVEMPSVMMMHSTIVYSIVYLYFTH